MARVAPCTARSRQVRPHRLVGRDRFWKEVYAGGTASRAGWAAPVCSGNLVRGARRDGTAIGHSLSPARSRDMIKELDPIVLTESLAEQGLRAGDVGWVVMVHVGGAGYEVEFVTLAGETVSVVTVPASAVRAVQA